MEDRFIADFILNYCERHSTPNPARTTEIYESTKLKPKGYMCIGPLPGYFLRSLILLKNPKSVLEIGTFTGYTLSLFNAYTSPDCLITSLDDNKVIYEETCLTYKSELASGRITLVNEEGFGYLSRTDRQYDLMFIDARKETFHDKLDLIHSKLTKNGLLVADNALAQLKVFDPEKEWQHAAVEFNKQLKNDDRFTSMILPLRDGFNIAIKN